MTAPRRGFTLVELLVVIGIISILAAIVVPQAAGYFKRAKATAALADIQGIELALTTILSDAQVSDLWKLFDTTQVHSKFGGPGVFWSAEMLAQAQLMYTRTFYALLREGRNVLDSDRYDDQLGFAYAEILNRDAVKKLGPGYIDLTQDPWGENFYQIWPGPLKTPRIANGQVANPVPFRIFERSEERLPGAKANPDDGLILYVEDPDSGDFTTLKVGYPASTRLTAYIYSYGENLVSGQALVAPSLDNGMDFGNAIPYLTPESNPDRQQFYPAQESILMGGGDDVNNWDRGQSWMRFYR